MNDFDHNYEKFELSITEKLEEGVVRLLLNRYRLGDRKMTLLSAHEEKTGRKRLRLAVFHKMFPQFPLLIGFRPIYTGHYTVDKLLKRFSTLPLAREYEDFQDCVARTAGSRSIVLACHWPYLGYLALHSGKIDKKIPSGRFCVTGEDKRMLVLEPLEVLLASIDRASSGRREWFRVP